MDIYFYFLNDRKIRLHIGFSMCIKHGSLCVHYFELTLAHFEYISNMSLVMRKLAFCICENKEADQLRGNHELISAFVFPTRTVQFLCYLNLRFLAIFCSCTARFVSDQVRNPEDRFSHNEAHLERKTINKSQ